MGVRAVFLVGFMASGKSTVGPELANRLGWEFADLDSRIESREQKTVPAIFRERGEAGFRLAETAALQDLMQNLAQSSVVGLGGGAFAQQRNRELLQDWPTVFLNAPAEELWRRSQADKIERPLRKDREQFSRLYAERLPFYREATMTVETAGKDASSICWEIEQALRLAISNNPGGHDSLRTVQSKSGKGDSK
jgi:shikimate kinase